MATPTRWLIAFCSIAVALLTCAGVDASSFRDWLYVTTVALVLPIALSGALPADRGRAMPDAAIRRTS